MCGDIFEQLLSLLRQDALSPAISRIFDLIEGVPIRNLDPAAQRRAMMLSADFHQLEEARINNIIAPDEAGRKRAALRGALETYVRFLRDNWGALPKPAIACGAAAAPPIAATGVLPPDSRDRSPRGNPIRHLSWLEEAIRVSRAVCKIVTPAKSGTGFLLPGGRVVTNNHVIASATEARSATALFDFREALGGPAPTPVPIRLDPKRLFKTNADPDRDCTVVALDAGAAELARWGALTLAVAGPDVHASVSIIQHPEGGPKMVGLSGNLVQSERPDVIFYATSTMPGSSGAPVFDDAWQVVALHQGAGQWSARHDRYVNNRGIKMSALLLDPMVGPALR
jgi:hypothetical protein